MMLQSSRHKAASAVESTGSNTPKSHRRPNFLPPLAQRRHRRRNHSTKKPPTGGSVSTHSTSYLSSDSETDTTISSVTVGRRHKEPLPRNVGGVKSLVCHNDWVGYGTRKERDLQYSDDEGSDDNDDDDSLEFLDHLLNESSGRWKNETGQIISTTSTARGPCGHMLSASSGASTTLGM